MNAKLTLSINSKIKEPARLELSHFQRNLSSFTHFDFGLEFITAHEILGLHGIAGDSPVNSFSGIM